MPEKKVKIPGSETNKFVGPGQQVDVRDLLSPDSLITEGMAKGKATLSKIGGGSLPGKDLGAKK